ncbi:lipopolysaccharide biosynthesis protein [Pseudomonadota bacterium]
MFNRVAINFGKVLRGRGIAGILSVASIGLAAHALPVEQFGLIILLHTYVKVVKGFFNFRTFEAIVRYGVPLQDSGDEPRLKSLLRSSMMIDFGSSLIAALIGVAAVPLASQFLHWDEQLTQWAWFYALILLTTCVNTSSGILRLYDRFDALGVQYTVQPMVRLLLVSLTWFFDGGMFVFLLAWGFAYCAGNIYMFLRGMVELRQHLSTPLFQGFRWREILERDREFWGFIGVIYWQTNLDLIPKQVSTLLAGNLLGPAAAGLFRLAREISTVLSRPAALLRDVLFPDLTRAWHSDQSGFKKLQFQTSLIAGCAGLLIVVFAWFAGEYLLALIGEDYVPAKPLMVLLLLAASFELASAPLRAAAYAAGKASTLLRIHILGIGLYIVFFYLVTGYVGLIGPGLASVMTSMLTFSLTARLIAHLKSA